MENESQIKNIIENWAAGVRNRDIASILAHHSTDVVMFDVPLPFRSVGLTAYQKTWDYIF